MIEVYAIPEIKTDAITRVYVDEIFGRPLIMLLPDIARPMPVDALRAQVPIVKMASRREQG